MSVYKQTSSKDFRLVFSAVGRVSVTAVCIIIYDKLVNLSSFLFILDTAIRCYTTVIRAFR